MEHVLLPPPSAASDTRPKSKIPAWLAVSVGYGVEGLFGARENIAKDANGNATFNRTDIKRYRQWFLAPDIDPSKIKTDSKALKFFLFFTISAAFFILSVRQMRRLVSNFGPNSH